MSGDVIMALLVYFFAASLANIVAYLLLHNRWSRRERARFVVGVLVVMVPALGVAVAGFLDFITVAAILAAFTVAGLITLALDIETESALAQVIREGFDAEGD